MTREHTVAVKAKDGGSVTHCASQFALKLKAGETATKWEDGSPITRAEFEAVLEPTGLFEIAVQPPATKIAAQKTEA